MVLAFFIFKNPSPENAFRRYIINPIPNSVSEMEVDFIDIRFDHIFVFKFSISEKDLQNLLRKKGFKLAGPFTYENGRLKWESLNLNLYEHRKEPEWFDLDTWDSAKIYEVELRGGHEQYLILPDTGSVVYIIDNEWA